MGLAGCGVTLSPGSVFYFQVTFSRSDLDQLGWQVLQGWSGWLGVLNGEGSSSEGRGRLDRDPGRPELAHAPVEVLHREGIGRCGGQPSLLLLLVEQQMSLSEWSSSSRETLLTLLL